LTVVFAAGVEKVTKAFVILQYTPKQRNKQKRHEYTQIYEERGEKYFSFFLGVCVGGLCSI